MLRSEVSNALPKLFVKNLTTNIEEELIFCDEKVYSPGISLMQKSRNTNKIYIEYDSPKSHSKVYQYNLKSKKKKLIKEQVIPSGHNPDDYIVERKECKSHDGKDDTSYHYNT